MAIFPTSAIPTAASTGYDIDNSLRFNDDDSAYLSRTPTTAGNRKTWTWSGWVKRGNLGINSVVFQQRADSNSSQQFGLQFLTDDTLRMLDQDGTTVMLKQTTQVFRDTSAWYHIVVAVDITESAVADKAKLYVNGEEITDWSSSTNYANNTTYDTAVNNNVRFLLGVQRPNSSSTINSYLDGYLSEVNLIDGAAKEPDNFGEFDATYGHWKPKAFDTTVSGSYGTNGFYLPMNQDYTVEGFSATTYSGSSSDQYIGGVGFQPDLCWIKQRSGTAEHEIVDSVRGNRKLLSSDGTGAELDRSFFKSFDTDGFSVETGVSNFNTSGSTYVAWSWDMGGTLLGTGDFTQGTIPSTCKASTTYGQSIVSYTGSSSSGSTVGHGLSSAPELVIIKSTNATSNWIVYSEAIGNNYLYFNTNAASPASWFGGGTSVFTLNNTYSDANNSSRNYIAYCFHSVEGYSKVGSYTGNGSSDGPFVHCGFAVSYVMIKPSNATGHWLIVDTARDPYNQVNDLLRADSSGSETGSAELDIVSNGFKYRGSSTNSSYYHNVSGKNYIFIAFAEHPFKYSTAK